MQIRWEVFWAKLLTDGQTDKQTTTITQLAYRRQFSGPQCIRFHLQADPFLRRRVNGSADGGEEFEGFIPDLLKHVFRMLDVDYEISLVKDGRYGEQTADGSWDGMIGELTRGVSKLCDFTSAKELMLDSCLALFVCYSCPR